MEIVAWTSLNCGRKRPEECYQTTTRKLGGVGGHAENQSNFTQQYESAHAPLCDFKIQLAGTIRPNCANFKQNTEKVDSAFNTAIPEPRTMQCSAPKCLLMASFWSHSPFLLWKVSEARSQQGRRPAPKHQRSSFSWLTHQTVQFAPVCSVSWSRIMHRGGIYFSM